MRLNSPLHLKNESDQNVIIKNKNDDDASDKYSVTIKGENNVERNNVVVDSIQDRNQPPNVNELQLRLWETSKQVVKEGEKNVTLALDLVKVRDNLKNVQEENRQLRLALLHGINNDVSSNVDKFMNIPLYELLRLRLQEYKDSNMESSMNFSVFGSKKLDTFLQSGHPPRSDKTEAINHTSDNDNSNREMECDRLKKKLSKMMDTSRREREVKLKLEREIGSANERVEALSEHIEKLMIHLKHEATSKAKSLAECSRCHKEIELLKRRNQAMEKRNLRKNRAIDDLKDGAKILEDQLTLMDEKYMELRMKLDWTRTQTERVMRKKEEEIKDLRAKLLLAKQDLMALKTKKRVSRHFFSLVEIISVHHSKHSSCLQNKPTKQQGDSGDKKPLLSTSPKRKNNLNVQKLPSTSDGIT